MTKTVQLLPIPHLQQEPPMELKPLEMDPQLVPIPHLQPELPPVMVPQLPEMVPQPPAMTLRAITKGN